MANMANKTAKEHKTNGWEKCDPHTGRQTDRRTDRWTDRQRDKSTDKHTNMQTRTYASPSLA